MYAIIETGGKQYRVQEGDVIYVEKLEGADGDKIKFDKVVAYGEGDKLEFGAPYVKASIEGKIVKTGKGKKITVFTYKPKKGKQRKLGHRQPFTKVEIVSVKKTASRAKKAEAPAPEAAE